MSVVRWWLCIFSLAASTLLAQNANSAPSEVTTQTAAPVCPNTILITIDTTRADRMGFLGSKRGLTPNLDGLAQQSAVFTQAYSQAPLTPTSHATILTGTYPQYHQILTFKIPLAKDLPYMPDILKAHGYSTAAFVGSLALDPVLSVPGFERGFDTYDANYNWDAYTPNTRYQSTERRAGDVVARALAWLDKHQQSPFFLWVHLYDPHEPYDPPQPYKTRYAKALYDGEIAYTDSAIGKLLRQLKARGLYDGALIAVTSDHGESLGAHGEDTHGVFVYDETIHVPLVIKLPHGGAAGRRVETRVELADIMPTLLQSEGIEVPTQVQGESLLELMKPGPAGAAAAEAWRDKGAYSQADYGHLVFAWSALQSLRTGKYLYIQAPRRELYDDGADTKAERNLAPKSPAVADTLSSRLEAFRQKTTNTRETPKASLDADRVNKLAALGYMAPLTDAAMGASTERGADPKDKIATANTIMRINDILQNWRCDKALPELHKAILTSPNVSMLHFFLGGCYMENKDFAKAVPELRKAVEIDPGFTRAAMNLGRASLKVQDYDGAATAFERVIKTDPNIMDAHVLLVVVYAQLNRPQDEIRECRRVLEVVPDHFGSNLNLGRFLAQSGDLQGAIAPLQKAASVRPTRPAPHMYLADVYKQLGREEDAKREQAEAERLDAAPAHPPGAEPDTGKSDPN
ncbi:MAG: sulfatase-like hydrolase/transferase [Acidobacteriia bacterium]|nr:sulfatase-like hydrolase/transferase [Terriglobia bacterium]